MPGQLFSEGDTSAGFMYSDQLSKYLRTEVQPRTKFRQFADAKDHTDKGLHRGDKASWKVYSKIANQGGRLNEVTQMPESGFTESTKTLTVYEAGNSVPYTGKLDALAEHDVQTVIDKTLRDDCRKFHDIEVFNQFDNCALRVVPDSGTSTTALTLTTNGSATETNQVAFGTGHAKAVADLMKERNIPAFYGDDYVAITHPTTLRTFKNSLEAVKQYTETGLGHIFRGEIGRYESIRFVEQNFIPKGGAIDSVTFDPATGTADAWNGGDSSWIFFMGEDTVAEALVIPEEIRAKLPGDYGRSKGIAWYYLGGYGLVHDDATNCRIVKWDSAA
jgi:N4-gp56 family major capsid protein